MDLDPAPAREQWLRAAAEATRTYIASEEAQNDWDLRTAAPGSGDYDRALDSRARVAHAATTLAALEAELTAFR